MKTITSFCIRWNNRFPWLFPLLGYGVVTVLVFSAALLPKQGMMLYGDDIHRQYYFFREFFTTWMHKGIFPWWNPYLFGGEPFIANPVVNIWYLPTWLFVLLPLPIAYPVHIALHIVWAELGMYFLLRGTQKSGSLSAWVSGIVFGLSGFFMARTFAGHVDVIAAASWMPWVVSRFNAMFNRQHRLRNGIVAAFVFGCQLFSGYQTIAFFTAIAVGIMALVHSIQNRSFAPLRWAVAAGIGGLGLAAIQVIPEQEFFRQSIRTLPLPYSWISYGSITWQSLIQLIHPFYFGTQYTYAGPPPNFIEHAMFIGIGGLILAIAGIVALQKRPAHERALGIASLCTTVLGIWIALGPHAPMDLQYLLWKIIPMYHYVRIPARHLVLAVFGMSVASGLGFAAVARSFRIPTWGRMLLALAVTGELVLFAKGFIVVRDIPEKRHDASLIGILTSTSAPSRLLENYGVWLPQRDSLDFDSPMAYGIFSATGYDPSILKSYYSFIASATGMPASKAVLSQDVQVPYLTPKEGNALDTLNIRYIMVPRTLDPFLGNTRYRVVVDNTYADFRVYENTTVLPRFYLRDAHCGGATVSSYTPNAITVRIESACDTMLDSSEVWYPGWTAYVDGKKTSIDKLNDTFRTILVPAGNHTIRMVYEPWIFVEGGIVSLSTLLILAVFWSKERSSRPS